MDRKINTPHIFCWLDLNFKSPLNIASLCSCAAICYVLNQIEEGEYKDPNKVYKVPIEPYFFNHFVVSTAFVSTYYDVKKDDYIYYNKVEGVSITRPLRDFHNLYVKNILVNSISKKGDTLIDYAMGKGGDLPKWIYANLSFVFGLDISRDNIENKLDGACARYINYKKKFNVLPKVMFIQGNAGLNIRKLDAQFTDKGKQITEAVFGNGPKDEKLLGKGVYNIYGKGEGGFNVSSIQFALHYMFENNNTSLVKAEKVVNEPKKPIIAKGLIRSLFEKFIAKKIPIKKQPIKLTANVPKGKPKNIIFVRNELKRNLEIAPKKAPTPIRR